MKIILFKKKNKKLKKEEFPGIICNKKERISIKINNNNYYYNILKINTVVLGYMINKKYSLKVTEIKYHPYKKLIIHINFIILNNE